MSAEHHLIFVYGTLKRGGSNQHFMRGQTFQGKGHTTAGFRLINLGTYPGMIAAPNSSESVSGELWLVDSDCLAQLDALEGLGEGLYRRERIRLLEPFADRVIETYLFAQDVAGRPTIPDGRWLEPPR
ncbi:MAG: gamma-glutamylcyclotransferase family protein [Opitutus sp.]